MTQPIYQVKDWPNHFENDRSKERDRCSFVCVPNKQHGMGFSYVMAEKDGAMVYGIWQLIIGACSQQKRPRQGWLTSDGTGAGIAWTVDDLATKFRRPASEIRRAIEVLSSSKVDWLLSSQVSNSNDLPPTHDALPTNSLPTPLEGKGKEGNRMEGNTLSGKPDDTKIELMTKARIVLHWLNEKAGRNFRETGSNLQAVAKRITEVNGDVEGIKKMIERQVLKWKNTEYDEYLRISTLFTTQKFNEYYDNRELPVLRNAPAADKPNPRNVGTCAGVTDYAAAAKRKLERQEAARGAGEVAGQVAANENAPSTA